jgi:hypothetical protein
MFPIATVQILASDDVDAEVLAEEDGVALEVGVDVVEVEREDEEINELVMLEVKIEDVLATREDVFEDILG